MKLDEIYFLGGLLSNILSPMVIVFSLSVVVIWFNPTLMCLKRINTKSSEQWFIIGVFFGFFGEVVDNIYWTVFWCLNFLNLDISHDIQNNGIFNNLIFRQFLTILAAYCHIKSAIQYTKRHEKTFIFTHLFVGSIIMGIGLTIILLTLR